MNHSMNLKNLLDASGETRADRLAVFALLNLGMVESLANGLVSAEEALRLFFHAENCLFVDQELRSSLANEIMSRGVQLPDLFEALSADEVHREFQRELAILRGLCLKILEAKRLAA